MRTCQQEAGQLQEIHFFLFGQPILDAWLQAAEEAQLQPAEERQEL